MTIPNGANCLTSTFAAQRPFLGIKNLIISAYGATWTLPDPNEGLGFGGNGIVENNTTYANFITSSAGASSVTLVTAGQSSIFTVGQWVAVTGGDLQGFGYPPNPFLFEYAKVTAINAGTGVISFQSPLTNAYKSTWPNFYAGDGNHAYSGGPGTLYALPSDWDTTVEVQGLIINNQANHQTGSNGRSMTFRDVTCLDFGCLIPSQNLTWAAINYQATNQQMEADKMVGTMTLTNSTVNRIDIQSASVQNCVFSGSTITDFMHGTCLINSFANTAFGNLEVGVTGYGGTTSVVCSTCSFPLLSSVSVVDTGTVGTNAGVNNAYQMSSGVIIVPRSQDISAASNNGSGLIRLTLTSTAAWITGQTAQVFNGTGTTNLNGTWVLTVIDGTHVDLQGSTFSGTYTGGAQMGQGSVRWAYPGAQMHWSGVSENEASFKVVDVTGDSVNTYVATDQAGGFPSVPQASGKLSIRVHPAPVFTCTSCSGSAVASSLSLATPGAPLFSYYKQTFTGASFGSGATALQALWGSLVSFKFTVTTPYTGVTGGSIQARPAEQTVVSGTTDQFYGPFYNIKIAGTRTTTPSGVTGTQSGDSGLALADPAQRFSNTLTMQFNPDISAECVSTPAVCPTLTIEVTTDQVLVIPYLLKRDLAPASNDNSPMWLNQVG